MYANDTSITFTVSDADEMNNCINLDLERIRGWLAASKLTLLGQRQNLTDWFKAKVIKFYSESYWDNQPVSDKASLDCKILRCTH